MADVKSPKVENMLDKNTIKLATQGQRSLKDLRTHLKIVLNDILNKDIINKHDGRVARISTTGLHKISSQKALNKSLNNGFTQEEHYKAGELIKDLYKNSNYLKSERANNNSADIKAIHRYVSLLQINGKNAQSLITLKENVQSGNRIYSLELEGLSPRP